MYENHISRSYWYIITPDDIESRSWFWGSVGLFFFCSFFYQKQRGSQSRSISCCLLPKFEPSLLRLTQQSQSVQQTDKIHIYSHVHPSPPQAESRNSLYYKYLIDVLTWLCSLALLLRVFCAAVSFIFPHIIYHCACFSCRVSQTDFR